ncbi:MAG: hypothetical protein ACOX80_06870 [Methanomassiliicoccaceae archaeon]|nr:hypothetical protein [Methanomassiliicoccaceae archaeon]HQD87794.1 hypothetical protein [Methanomassiliicoccaceae archaeon]
MPVADPSARSLAILLIPWNMLITAGSMSIMLMLMVINVAIMSEPSAIPGNGSIGTTTL